MGVLTAFLFWQKSRFAIPIAVIWVVAGLGDFINALNVGTQLSPEVAPALQFWPLFLIPGYVVPIFIASQIYAIRALLKIRQPNAIRIVRSKPELRLGLMNLPPL